MKTLPKKLTDWLTASGFTKADHKSIYQWSNATHQKPILMLGHSADELIIFRSMSTRRTKKPGIRWQATVPLAMPTQAIIDLLAALTAHETRF